jgi:hypothetical protein
MPMRPGSLHLVDQFQHILVRSQQIGHVEDESSPALRQDGAAAGC